MIAESRVSILSGQYWVVSDYGDDVLDGTFVSVLDPNGRRTSVLLDVDHADGSGPYCVIRFELPPVSGVYGYVAAIASELARSQMPCVMFCTPGVDYLLAPAEVVPEVLEALSAIGFSAGV